MNEKKAIGYLVGGSLKDAFRIRLTVPASEIQEGSFVTLRSGQFKFFGLVTDIRLGATDPRFADEQSEERLPHSIAALLHGQTLYTELEVLPSLMLECGFDPGDPNYKAGYEPEKLHAYPVKTMPAHHAAAFLADAFEIGEIFGNVDDPGKFQIGETREQGHAVAIDLKKFTERSSGIFGATGTGKSYLTRLILAGLIHSKVASVLVFDMHNEYAFGDTSPDTGISVPGLKDKLSAMVRVCALGRSTKINQRSADFDLVFEYKDIQTADIEMLSQELNLRETTAATLSALANDFGKEHWFQEFMKMSSGGEDDEGSVAYWATHSGRIHPKAAEALRGKLERLYKRAYLTEKAPSNCVKDIIAALESGCSVILSFGEYESDLDYLLITNILTRKIREAWEKTTNEYRGKNGPQPKPLVIAIEEAHKLLNREMAGQTAFAVIAREMRKYFVTLLVIDQRPSQIYDEVMSQLGTRVSGWLGDDADISAVLSGLAGKDALRGMLARLQPKEEVLMLGYGVPMPLPIRSRRYNDDFWKALQGEQKEPAQGSNADRLKALFGD